MLHFGRVKLVASKDVELLAVEAVLVVEEELDFVLLEEREGVSEANANHLLSLVEAHFVFEEDEGRMHSLGVDDSRDVLSPGEVSEDILHKELLDVELDFASNHVFVDVVGEDGAFEESALLKQSQSREARHRVPQLRGDDLDGDVERKPGAEMVDVGLVWVAVEEVLLVILEDELLLALFAEARDEREEVLVREFGPSLVKGNHLLLELVQVHVAG